MNNLQQLLTHLGSQKLTSGYLTSAGTAHDTLRALKQQFDPYTLMGSPLPNMTNQVGAPNVLFSPAWVARYQGQDAIYLNDVNGRLSLSHTPLPAYTFTNPV